MNSNQGNSSVISAGRNLPVRSLNTVIIGSGAAARNAALQLVRRGVTDIALVTEKWNAGTSYNAGSDKQTYYKLSLGRETDSPEQLARDLFSGGSMHGDIALCEAMGSAQAFFNLVQVGVPFPHDRYGGYPGYRTDNDSGGRATSAGPLTSRFMCEGLGRELERAGVPVFDGHQVVGLLTRSSEAESGSAVCGAVAIKREELTQGDFGLVVFNTRNVVLATGGPGGMYRDSVYPQSQRGTMGMALRAGAVAQNLTESQFGLASVGFRWNLSGSYQQVVPRYLSTTPDGEDERDFLNGHFPDMETLAAAIFRKGYEWPFDCGRVADHGSSLIDLLVYREIQAGRRVFLDFTRNPQGGDGIGPFTTDLLSDEAREYLQPSGAFQDSPISRLEALNQPAVQLFRENGIDLSRDYLEIAVCAQHNNGGLRADIWWQSNVEGLFPIGEVCGTHGVRRPGGAALNAGQVGAMRAASFIADRRPQPPLALGKFQSLVGDQLESVLDFCRRACGLAGDRGDTIDPARVVGEIQHRMSRCAGHVRDFTTVEREVASARELQRRVLRRLRVSDVRALTTAFWAADLCLTHLVFLEAIRTYLEAGGRSRGSSLVLEQNGSLPCPTLENRWRFDLNEPGNPVDRGILEVWLKPGDEVGSRWVPVRPIPGPEGPFEEVWKSFREGAVIP